MGYKHNICTEVTPDNLSELMDRITTETSISKSDMYWFLEHAIDLKRLRVLTYNSFGSNYGIWWSDAPSYLILSWDDFIDRIHKEHPIKNEMEE